MGELGGEILTPGSDTTLGGGALQWPLPVAGTITSPQGYRTDPITGETSYHSGTDIAVPEGTPILAAADGTVTIANALDSWGGSYGYHVKLDHGGGLTTLYAHCSSMDIDGVNSFVIRMPSFNGKTISGTVTRSRIVTDHSDSTWEWGYYVTVKLSTPQTVD